MFDAEPLLFPKKEPAPRLMAAIDALSWWLPGVAGVLSIFAGLSALDGWNAVAALLGIGGGAAGAFGVFFANWASRVRDERLRVAYAVASLGVEMADGVQRSLPSGI